MSLYYYILFTIFTVIAIMIVVDQNVGDYIILQLKFLQVRIERLWWMFIHHPNNFITTWIQNRKYDRIARELQEEMERKRIGFDNHSKIDK